MNLGQIRTDMLIALAVAFALGVLVGWAWPDLVALWNGIEAIMWGMRGMG